MKATIIYLNQDRADVQQQMAAGLKGASGIQPIDLYGSVAVVPMHEGDYNLLLAELESCYMGWDPPDEVPRDMVPGDLVVFDDGSVFLADTPDKWTQLGEEQAAPFRELATAS